jgi:PD-(D/E)XK nuclease superfamily protein
VDILKPKQQRHTMKTGTISEQACVTHLLQVGYNVLLPVGQMHRYDLVIEDADGQLWKVQVKTGRLTREGATVTYSNVSQTYHYNGVGDRGGTRRQSYIGQVDYFAIYAEELQKVYLIPTTHATGVLRLKATKNNQEKLVRRAKDYEL